MPAASWAARSCLPAAQQRGASCMRRPARPSLDPPSSRPRAPPPAPARSGMHERAVQYFRRALRLNPSYLSAWTLMGHEYVELKNPPAAIGEARAGRCWPSSGGVADGRGSAWSSRPRPLPLARGARWRAVCRAVEARGSGGLLFGARGPGCAAAAASRAHPARSCCRPAHHRGIPAGGGCVPSRLPCLVGASPGLGLQRRPCWPRMPRRRGRPPTSLPSPLRLGPTPLLLPRTLLPHTPLPPPGPSPTHTHTSPPPPQVRAGPDVRAGQHALLRALLLPPVGGWGLAE